MTGRFGRGFVSDSEVEAMGDGDRELTLVTSAFFLISLIVSGAVEWESRRGVFNGETVVSATRLVLDVVLG